MVDSKQAEKMSAYMQNRFEFLETPKPKLKEESLLTHTKKRIFSVTKISFYFAFY